MSSLWNRIRGAEKNHPQPQEQSIIKESSEGEKIGVTSPWSALEAAKATKPEVLKEFWLRTGMFRVSAQKLNMLGRQITNLSIPDAVLQMKFSPKRPATKVYELLKQAEGRIRMAKADPKDFIVQQATVGKGTYLKRIDIKGRGKFGIIWRPHSFMRMQVAIPDLDKRLKKLYKVNVPKEDKPVFIRMDY